MAQGVPVYLDPYEKTNLKGQAMLIARIADTDAETHHGVTCQRWLVQFDEGQDYEARWVDPDDFTAWDLPFIGTACITFSRQGYNFAQGVTYAHVKYGECPNITIGALRIAAYVAPFPGRVRRVSLHSHCAAIVGTPDQLSLRINRNADLMKTILIDDWDDNGVYNYQLSDDWNDFEFDAADTLNMVLRCQCGAGETLAHNYLTITLHLQFNPSYAS